MQVVPVHPQSEFVDCGLFSIAYGVELLLGGNPAHMKFQQDEMRGHLITCLRKEHITPFPKTHDNKHIIKPYEAISEHEISLACPCGRPNVYDDMVRCDNCFKWLHLECENINCENDVQEKWTCSQCNGIHSFSWFVLIYRMPFVIHTTNRKQTQFK